MSGQIWMNGELVPYEDAKVHVLTHALHYGTSVFEGVRAYEMPDGGSAVFRHQDHIDRLFRSAGLYHMDIGFSKEEIRQATFDTITASGLKSCYIRPLVFRGAGPDGPLPAGLPGRRDDRRLGVGRLPRRRGQAQRRPRRGLLVAADLADSLIPTAKAGGQYLNSILAKIEADKAGYEEAILLDSRGYVCEGTGENLFLVKDGRSSRRASPTTSSRASTALAVIEILRDQGYEVIERDVARGELYRADEIFMTGTAAELTPIREVDDMPSATAPAARSPRRSRRSSRTPCTGARSATRTGWTRFPRPSHEPDRRLRHHPARRDAGGGDVAVRRGEGARRADPRRARRADDRGGLPDLEPEGARALRAAARGGTASRFVRSG